MPRRTRGSTHAILRSDAADPGGDWATPYRARLVAGDVAAVAVAVLGAFSTAALLNAAPAAILTPQLLAFAVWVTALSAFRTRDERLFAVGAGEYKRVVSASTIAIGALAVSFLSLATASPRAFLLIAWAYGVPLLLLERWEWRRWLNRQRQVGRSLPHAIIVGNVHEVTDVIRQMSRGPTVYAVVGVAIEEPVPDSSLHIGTRSYPVVGLPSEVATAAARVGAEALIVAGAASGGSDFIKRLAWRLEGTSVELVLATRLTEIAGPRIHFQLIGELPLMHVDIPRFEGGKHLAKRALDVAGSAIGLILLSPLFLAIALAVRLDSPGGAIFRQERVGRGGRTFTLLKFRSMSATAEQDLAALLERNEGNGVLFKLRDDPRVTTVGRVLRKHSLDELPQLWNVLVGDMSLVGPRPPLPREAEDYEAHVRRRLYLKPGLTGPWQVSGRSDLDWEESVRLDLHYIENWSLIGDLMLLWRTARIVLHPVGAY